eukprot:TRINITY_DN14723_c0_g1_i1.p1 TRINITY_DN14723_c0_g1~~TRINITY_DN14723_c0_g1_i1.p1  ORF type:complete len:480 (-),score=64.14 TRINITY_DN14723_c0_g1_i1:776-2215(-)
MVHLRAVALFLVCFSLPALVPLLRLLFPAVVPTPRDTVRDVPSAPQGGGAVENSLNPPLFLSVLPHSDAGVILPQKNIHDYHAKRISLLQHASRCALQAGRLARCPELMSCGGAPFCTHLAPEAMTAGSLSPARLTTVATADALANNITDHVFVVSNVLVYFSGHVVRFTAHPPPPIGPSHSHYQFGLCWWANADAGKADVKAYTQHVRNAAHIAHPYGANFYHFVAETLPKYFQLVELLRASRDTYIITSHKFAALIDLFFPDDKFAQRTIVMKLWGEGKRTRNWKIQGAGKYRYVMANRLFLPLSPTCGQQSASLAAETYHHYWHSVRPRLDASEGDIAKPEFVLLYTRNNFTNNRALMENAALFHALQEKYGSRVRFFTGVFAETLQEDLQLLRRARLLLGPHGAGLAAMLFLPKDASVFEIRPKSYLRDCFERQARTYGLDYHMVLGDGGYEGALSVDIHQVVRKAAAILESQQR